ncbi:MAG: hypothetical protein IJD97_10125 [Clostridia bacterium]|nr:hypothetical protein [Clostridia bacterium]
MLIKEKLSWILDKKGKSKGEKEYQINIDFVHSLGKKCDCVGWSKLYMDEADANDVLDEIKRFCKKNGWTARGFYERTYQDVVSDWYEVKTGNFKDESFADRVCILSEDGEDMFHIVMRAYHELTASPKEWLGVCVSERFRNACIKNNVEDVDFCWIQDKGKYEAMQWFYIYPKKQIAHIACDRGLKKSDYFKIKALGGALPKIASIFSELQYISLPNCYLAEDMPDGGIAHAYRPSTDGYCGRDTILIHKDTAEMLIAEKALSPADLEAVCIFETCPKGYNLIKTQKHPKPTVSYIEQSLSAYEKTKKSNRPVRAVSEKDALKMLRKSKTERKDDFQKKISKGLAEAVTATEYSALLPYYQVANGGYLSDEYELLSYEKALVCTEELLKQLNSEELFEADHEWKVFAVCADGDLVIFTKEGKALRFSHEAPEIINEWQTVAQFFFDAVSEY